MRLTLISAFSALIISTTFLLTSCCNNTEDWEMVLQDHIRRYPQIQPVDIYKIVYQATMGMGHFIADTSQAHLYLLQEFTDVNPDTSIPLCEFVSPDSNMLRINLAPFKAYHGDVESLFQAMMLSARQFSPSVKSLQNGLYVVSRLSAQNKIPLAEKEWMTFIEEMKSKNYPLPHHSPQYNQLYHPAYRVITKTSAASLSPNPFVLTN